MLSWQLPDDQLSSLTALVELDLQVALPGVSKFHLPATPNRLNSRRCNNIKYTPSLLRYYSPPYLEAQFVTNERIRD